jgi:hypothetical protein
MFVTKNGQTGTANTIVPVHTANTATTTYAFMQISTTIILAEADYIQVFIKNESTAYAATIQFNNGHGAELNLVWLGAEA